MSRVSSSRPATKSTHHAASAAPKHSKAADKKHGHHGHSSFAPAAKGKHHDAKQVTGSDPSREKFQHSLHGKSTGELEQMRANEQLAHDAYLAMTPPDQKGAAGAQWKMDTLDDAIAFRAAKDPSLSVDDFKQAIDGMGKGSLQKLQQRLEKQLADAKGGALTDPAAAQTLQDKLDAVKGALAERTIDSKKSTPAEVRKAAQDLSPEALAAKTQEVRAKYDAMREKMADPSYALKHRDQLDHLAQTLKVLESLSGGASAPAPTAPPADPAPAAPAGAVDPVAGGI